MTELGGRTAQKERTRQAILDGARRLLGEGKPVTVAAAAEQHNISKATAYRYFSDPALLVAEAGLDVSVAPYEDIVAGCGDVRARLMAISLYFFDLAVKNEAGFRQFVGMTLAAWTPDDRAPPGWRGARRISMYRQALSDRRDKMGKTAEDMLVVALATATGAEAMIALFDVAKVDRSTARDVVRDIAEAVIDRYLGPEA